MKGVKHLVLLIIIVLSSISSKRLLSSNEIQEKFYFSSVPIISAQPYEITATPFPSSSISLNDIVSFTFIDDKQEEMLYCKELTAQCPNKLDVDDKTNHLKLSIKNINYANSRKVAKKFIRETVHGFSTLKHQLPLWIAESEKKYKKTENSIDN